jgi:DNA replication and repair protein RecF
MAAPGPPVVATQAHADATSLRVCLTSLVVRQYRNLADVALDVPAEGLVLVGDNGHGKTNLLEACYLLQLLRGVRGARDAESVRFGEAGWYIEASGDFARATQVSVGFDARRRKKQVKVDGAERARLADAAGYLPSVYVSPGDQQLASGGPTERRRFLDVTLGLASPAYLAALAAYRHALSQRNAALRSGAARAAVAVWEPALARHGAVLWAARQAWVAAWRDTFAAHCAAIGERAVAAVALRTPGARDGAVDVHALAAALERQREHDARRGLTHAGPHRDDLHLTLDGRDLRTVGSAGQQRTAAFALRLLEAATLREATGAAPLLLLDDPFAELDATRAGRILGLLRAGGLGQTVLAVPRATDVPPTLSALARWRVHDGQVTAEAA